MLQLAEIVLAILGLAGNVSIQAVCWTVIGCELARIGIEMIQDKMKG